MDLRGLRLTAASGSARSKTAPGVIRALRLALMVGMFMSRQWTTKAQWGIMGFTVGEFPPAEVLYHPDGCAPGRKDNLAVRATLW